MRAYKSIFKIRFVNSLQYRTAAIAGVFTQIVFGLMYVMLFKAFYAQGNVPSDFTQHQMISYIWLQQMFFALFLSAQKNNTIALQIEQGNICYEMVRPIKLYANWFSTIIAESMSKTLLRFIPVLTVAILLPGGWGIGFAASVPAFLLFLVNVVVGSMLVVALNMLCYCLMFKTMSSIGIFSILATISSIVCGRIGLPHFGQNGVPTLA